MLTTSVQHDLTHVSALGLQMVAEDEGRFEDAEDSMDSEHQQ